MSDLFSTRDLRSKAETQQADNAGDVQESPTLKASTADENRSSARVTGPSARRRGTSRGTARKAGDEDKTKSKAPTKPTPRRRTPRRSTSPARKSSPEPKISHPLIGITCSLRRYPNTGAHECEYYYVYEPFVTAIHKAGGLPVIIPMGIPGRYTNRIFDHLSGLVLAGGGDLDPNLYADLITKSAKMVDPKKDLTEIDLFNLAFNKNMPVLGICRGAQLMNVALDGTLYQDITGQIRMSLDHDPDFPKDENVHEITIEKDTKLHKALGETSIWVNSWHHQAIKLHGKGLLVTARASDGVVEAIEHPNKKWIIGVQWHPELIWQNDKVQANLFNAFVEACKS